MTSQPFSSRPATLLPFKGEIDCEQSLFFFRFSESNARARERRSRETRETRAAAREGFALSQGSVGNGEKLHARAGDKREAREGDDGNECRARAGSACGERVRGVIPFVPASLNN